MKEKTTLEASAASDPVDPRSVAMEISSAYTIGSHEAYSRRLAVEGIDELMVSVGARRAVSVTVAVQLEPLPALHSLSQGDVGVWRLVVHERGNRDTVRYVQVYGVLDLASWNDTSGAEAAASQPTARVPPPPMLKRRSGSVGTALAAAPLLAAPSIVVFEGSEIWQTVTGRFVLHNPHRTAAYFSILRLRPRDAASDATAPLPDCVFNPQHGSIAPQSERAVRFVLRPLCAGVRTYDVVVMDETDQEPVVVGITVNVRVPQYIRFCDFTGPPVLDFGCCAVRPGHRYSSSCWLMIRCNCCVYFFSIVYSYSLHVGLSARLRCG